MLLIIATNCDYKQFRDVRIGVKYVRHVDLFETM